MAKGVEGSTRISGIFAPTITGYKPDGSISLEGTRQFVRFLLDQGVDGLTPLGSAGESVALSLRERKCLLEAIVMENAGQVPIFAGTGDYGTAATIELSSCKIVGVRGTHARHAIFPTSAQGGCACSSEDGPGWGCPLCSTMFQF